MVRNKKGLGRMRTKKLCCNLTNEEYELVKELQELLNLSNTDILLKFIEDHKEELKIGGNKNG